MANVYDSRMLEAALGALMPIRRPRGRPRKRSKKLHVDEGYDFRRCREALRKRSIKNYIARRDVDSGERLGRHRWLKVRYERQLEVHQSFLELGCTLLCCNHVQ